MPQLKEQIPFLMPDDANSGVPLYRQIYKAIRQSILSGDFSPGWRLPSSRLLASQLGVSRITVVNAYEQLFAEGYLAGKIGAGTFVAKELPDDLMRTEIKTTAKPAISAASFPLRLSRFGQHLEAKNFSSGRTQTVFQPFQNGLTAAEEFPFDIWSRIAARWQRNPPRKILGYGDSQGFYPLREAIAAHLQSARGVVCSAEQIIVTAGAQQALDLTARIFLEETDAALIEAPCYREARNAFEAVGAKTISVPVDEEGFDVEKIPLSGAAAKLVYVTPSHQYPLGVTMTLARRLALIDWARASNAWIIEDDYNSEFRYNGRPLASLQGLDRDSRVIYIGTFSKTIFPSLRIGCLVVPPQLVDVFTAARALSDVHSSLIDQAILTEFITEGHFARHIRRMRRLYKERQQILVDECEKNLNGLLEVKKSGAGMHLVGWLPGGVSDELVSEEGIRQNLILAPVSSFCAKKMPRGGLILGYTGFDERQITEGVRQLAKVLKSKNFN